MISPVTYIFVQSKDTIEKKKKTHRYWTQLRSQWSSNNLLYFDFLQYLWTTLKEAANHLPRKKKNNTEECIITVLDFKSHELWYKNVLYRVAHYIISTMPTTRHLDIMEHKAWEMESRRPVFPRSVDSSTSLDTIPGAPGKHRTSTKCPGVIPSSLPSQQLWFYILSIPSNATYIGCDSLKKQR